MADKHQLYLEFQSRFPKEFILNMTLEQYTNLDKNNSFCFWVESKTYDLGSIWGGSSNKFGIFRYAYAPKDTDNIQWDDKYGWNKNYHADTAEEAFAHVKTVLIKIIESVENDKLEDIDSITDFGDVYKWKVAFLYSKERLVPIYKRKKLVDFCINYGMENAEKASIPQLQRYLIQQRGNQNPYDFYEHLLNILNVGNDAKRRKHWMYSPGENGSKWDFCKENNVICIGIDKVGDFSVISSRDNAKKRLQVAYNKPQGHFTNDSLAIWEFSHVMKPGDIVYAKHGRSRFYGRGIIESEYIYDESLKNYCNIRRVRWTHIGDWKAPCISVMKALTDITKYPDYVTHIEAVFGEKTTVLDHDISENSQSCNKWWLVGKPGIFNFASLKIGDEVEWTLYSDNGNKRHIFQHFLDAKAGDKVVGYSATPELKIVAILEVSKPSDGQIISFRMVEALTKPIPFEAVKENEDLQNMEFLKNPNGSFFSLTDQEYDAIISMIHQAEKAACTIKSNSEPYNEEKFLSEVYMSKLDYERMRALLLTKKNLILQGAPGVGKTYSAKRLAYSIIGEKDESRVEMVQFHQSYTYEDFIMGYKPSEGGGFELREGVFYNFCNKARQHPDKPFFFIIDEINRGNLSKIFGELLLLIENGYRDYRVKLAYRDEMFSVPSNLHIIGMMNTADRSLAMIDYALRRRFSFFELTPGFDSDGFKAIIDAVGNETFTKVIEGIKKLNKVISEELGSGFCIGHSYFCLEKATNFSIDWLKNVIDFDIAPMLKEYWFDDNDKYDSEIKKLTDLLK